MNEFLLVSNLIFTFFLVIVWHRIFGKTGMIVWVTLASLVANLEVQARITGFGLTQTLGNVLFASTFLATDILSEYHGRRDAELAVHISILACLSFILLSQFWLHFLPSADDSFFLHLRGLADNTPRIMASGLLVYILVEKLDIFLYHKLWLWKGQGTHQFLWLRNNVATIVSQAVNSLLFNFLAFYGSIPDPVLIEIIITTFIIYIATSLLDTPFLYLAKK